MWSVRKLTVLFVLVAALCGSGTAIADAPYVTVQNANVREQADVNSTRVITFPKGTRVDVTFKEGDWYAVSRDGIHFGYIWSELLAPEDQGSNVTEAPVAKVEEHAPTFDETDLKKFKALNECKECELSGANLKGANLSGADLTGAILRQTIFSNASLSGANLTGVELMEADLSGADLSGADLTGADLWNSNLENAKLSGANLSKANLLEAKLIAADLSEIKLIGAKLRGADLSGANLSGADLTDAIIPDTNMQGATLCKTKLPSGEDNSGC